MIWENHPAADWFPMMEGDAFDALVEDIRENRLREPIVITPDGLLLDGRNRLKACQKLGITPEHRTEASDPWKYVISTNLTRRHLTTSQRAIIGARYAERQRGGISGQSPGSSNASHEALPPSQEEAAALVGVSRGSVQRGRAVLNNGAPELVELVEAGEMTVNQAARIATKFSPGNQAAFVETVHEGTDPESLLPPDVGPRKITTRHKNRHDFITESAVEHLISTFDALNLALDRATGGLDPALTDEEVDQLLAGLSRSGRALARLRKLLNQRKEA